jgi:hypothetical protein
MKRDERSAETIARMFLRAVQKLDAFTGDPNLVYDNLRMLGSSEPEKVRHTMADIADVLSSAALNDEE